MRTQRFHPTVTSAHDALIPTCSPTVHAVPVSGSSRETSISVPKNRLSQSLASKQRKTSKSQQGTTGSNSLVLKLSQVGNSEGFESAAGSGPAVDRDSLGGSGEVGGSGSGDGGGGGDGPSSSPVTGDIGWAAFCAQFNEFSSKFFATLDEGTKCALQYLQDLQHAATAHVQYTGKNFIRIIRKLPPAIGSLFEKAYSYFRAACKHLTARSNKVIVVASCPQHASLTDGPPYNEDVFARCNKLNEAGHIRTVYDVPGSTNRSSRDGNVIFSCTDNRLDNMEHKKKWDTVKKSVEESFWFHGFKEKIKSALQAIAGDSEKVSV